MKNQTNWMRWSVVACFAIAMAWVESAVVLYLRTMIDRIDPYQAHPLPKFAGLEKAEIVREAATMIMLWTVGWLAGRTRQSRFGYFLIAFGIWDIFYYVFLKVLTNWPHSLMDWDILFLIPLPWWGPVIAPMGIAFLMVVFGTLVSQFEEDGRVIWPTRRSITLCGVGAVLALYAFMADALRIAGQGEQALRELLPTSFNWAIFSLGWLLMAVPLVEVARQVFPRAQVQLKDAKAD